MQKVVDRELKERVQKGPEVGIRSRRLAYQKLEKDIDRALMSLYPNARGLIGKEMDENQCATVLRKLNVFTALPDD